MVRSIVLKDGGEVDLDLGNYERFLDVELTRDHNITTGKVYSTVIEKERRGEYLGKTVQIIPHITEEIKRRIRQVSREGGCEICLIEVGGTVGDIESMPFLEAMRQLKYEESGNIFFVHVTLAPSTMDGEQKTKPTQHSVKVMRELGLQPDMIVVRCEHPLLSETKAKIGQFCDVPTEAVISAHNADDIYKVPLQMEKEGLARYLMKAMRLFPLEEHRDWDEFVKKMEAEEGEVKVAIVGKYTVGSQCSDPMEDAYLSIRESLKHAGIEAGVMPEIVWVDAEELEHGSPDLILRDMDGILVPGGFGSRGTEGKMKAVQYAREMKVPYLGHMLWHAAGRHRVRPQRLRPGWCEFVGVWCHASPGDCSPPGAGEDQAHGRDHASGQLSGSPERGQPGAQDLRHRRDRGEAPAPL